MCHYHVLQLELHVTYPVYYIPVYTVLIFCSRRLAFVKVLYLHSIYHNSQYTVLHVWFHNDFSWGFMLNLTVPTTHVTQTERSLMHTRKPQIWSFQHSPFPEHSKPEQNFHKPFSLLGLEKLNHLQCHLTVNLITFQCMDQIFFMFYGVVFCWCYISSFSTEHI